MKASKLLLMICSAASCTLFAHAQAQSAAPVDGEVQTQVQPVPAGASNGAVAAGLQAQTNHGTRYVCGGIGLDESTAIKSMSHDYGLMLTFAARSGNYLADINVTITDTHGKSVLNTTCGAPILLVDLPKNSTYKIHAEADGYAVDKTVQVKTKGRTSSVVLVWPRRNHDSEQMSDSSR